MASEGVRLVERLRLGERPIDSDWDLAASIIALRDAADAVVVAAADVVEDRDKASKRMRFAVRIRLLILAARRLEDVAADCHTKLEEYFRVRAEDEGDEQGEIAQDSAGSGSREAPSSAIRNELTETLEAGGMAAQAAEALGELGENIRHECAWLATSLSDFTAQDPDEDRTLDFCADVEARFAADVFDPGATAAFSERLEDAMNKLAERS